jgi:hypothetical protein
MSGVEHVNFFETRATAYSRGAMEGSWDGDVWAVPESEMTTFVDEDNEVFHLPR